MTDQAEGTNEHVLLHVVLTTKIIHFHYILTALQIQGQVSEKMKCLRSLLGRTERADSVRFQISLMVSHFGKDGV